jgi:glycosyltransferase involved in cell wall biosynthesis
MGPVPNKDLPQHYSTADVLVLPSIEEGLAMVMAEALACGCPVIATCNTGAEDLFEDREEGFIVTIRSVEALTEAMETVAQSRERGQVMRIRSRARVEAIGGWDAYGNCWARLVKGLMHD